MRLPRFRIRALMIVVAVVAVAMVQVRFMIWWRDSLFVGLVVEAVFIGVIVSIFGPWVLAAYLLHKDAAYAKTLRRGEVPAKFPRVLLTADPPEPK